MTAVRVDMTIEQGADWPGLAFPIYDEEGNPYDLTGCSAKGQVRRGQNDDDPILFTWSTDPADDEGLITLADSILTIRVLASESVLWEWTVGHYDIRLTNPSAPEGKQKWRIAQGVVNVDQEVTS
jgi:hypothetical protein